MDINDFYKDSGQQYAGSKIPNAKPTVDAINNKQNGPVGIPVIQNEQSQVTSALSGISNRLDQQRVAQAQAEKDLIQNKLLADERAKMSGLGNASAITASGSNNPGQDTGVGANYYDVLAKEESGGNYGALNKGSKAFGRYQFIPETEKNIASQLGLTVPQARIPANQEKMIRQFTNNNIAGLKKAGIPINNLTLYAAHQQGLGGAIAMFKGGQVNSRNLKYNLPSTVSPTAQNWISHWGPRFM